MKKPIVLTIMDGFGFNDNKEVNAIEKANTPCLDKIFKKYSRKIYLTAVWCYQLYLISSPSMSHLSGVLVSKISKGLMV